MKIFFELISYTVQNMKNGEITTFPCQDNWLSARDQAIELSVKYRNEAKLKSKTPYSGIKLWLQYTEPSHYVLNKTHIHYILNGRIRHSKDILNALNKEYIIASIAEKEFEKVLVSMHNQELYCIFNKYITLYYFPSK